MKDNHKGLTSREVHEAELLGRALKAERDAALALLRKLANEASGFRSMAG